MKSDFGETLNVEGIKLKVSSELFLFGLEKDEPKQTIFQEAVTSSDHTL